MVVAALQRLLALLELLLGVLLFCIVAENCLVDHRVVDLLLPAVVLGARSLERTAFLVFPNKIARLPFFADFEWVVREEMRLAPEVLPVVRVNTLGFVVFVVERTPLGLEVEHEKFLVSWHLVNEGGLDVLVGVCEGAELLVLAAGGRLGAKLSLVFLNVVEPLHFVVDVLAVDVGAALEGTEVNTIVVQCGAAALIELPVVVRAILWVVRLRVLALDHFEPLQIQMLYPVLICLKETQLLRLIFGLSHLRGLLGCLLRSGLLLGAFGGLFGEDLLHALHVRSLLLLEHVDFLKEFLRLVSVWRLALSHNYRHRRLRFLKKLVEDVQQVAMV